jgi:hypothetical protein
MKTKTILLICLFLGIGLTQLSAQNGKNSTGAVSGFDSYWYYLELPVICGGAEIDVLQGDVVEHVRPFYRGGVLIRQNTRTEGELTNSEGEIFKLCDIFKWDGGEEVNFGHLNLVGNQGTHYIVLYSFNSVTYEVKFLEVKYSGCK